MKNMGNKTKRLLITGCLAVVCVFLIAAIVSRFNTETDKVEAISPSNTSKVTTVKDVVNPDEHTEKTEKKDVVKAIDLDTSQNDPVYTETNEDVVNPTDPCIPQGETSQDSNEIVQTNTLEAVKPEPPDKPNPQGDTTNPKSEPEYKPEDTNITKPSDKPSEPKAGDKKDGKIYIPGFGWLKETGGQGTQVGSDGDINKQVGTMD